ncbi:MAG: ATP-dependent RNA helicase ddx51 [Peltula sp. TS41687]|nr:MAG: ATP-dependent RNA helicase ddx51 [Peltula sp. TS41687]
MQRLKRTEVQFMTAQMYARYVPPEVSAAPQVTKEPWESEMKRSVHGRSWDIDDEPYRKRARTNLGTPGSSSVTSTRKVSKAESRTIQDRQERRDHELDIESSVQGKSISQRKATSNGDDLERLERSHASSHSPGAEDDGIKKQKKGERRASRSTRDKDDQCPLLHSAEEQNEDDGKHREILAKYHKSTSKTKKHTKKTSDIGSSTSSVNPTQNEDVEEPAGLLPLPQSVDSLDITAKPAFSALPSWLENPILVPSTKKSPLEGFQINSKLLSLLRNKGYTEAFAIQSAVIPLLLSGSERHDGDVCISAATGSGKTLAYVLPLVEALRGRVVPRLRGLIVVPTRELVLQAREVCEMCCSGSGLKVQTAMGSRILRAEQEELIEHGQRYDPLAVERDQHPVHRTGDDLDYNFALDNESNDMKNVLPGHVTEYRSKVDILICTPGRLVEHIKSTSGFTLEHLQWLVIDEADKLLSQTFQGWMDVVMGSLERKKPSEELSLSEKILHRMGSLRPSKPARKVILSATMTKDLSKLSALHLRNPKLVVLDNVGSLAPGGVLRPEEADGGAVSEEIYDLPFSLQEWAISIGDGSEKPLYLLHILQNKILKTNDSNTLQSTTSSLRRESSLPTRSSSDEAFDSSHQSETSSSESDCSSHSASGSISRSGTPQALLNTNQGEVNRDNHGVLVFTKSNESAIRLSRLLTLLHPPYGSVIGTLTSTHASALRRKTLRSFTSKKLSILIASDLVARGMDIANLAHVINYDLPTSVRGYVHRVGRTARAGNEGQAWSLVADKEARWFWNAIARGKELSRGQKKVVRYRVNPDSIREEQKSKYEEAIRMLGQEVRGSR